MLMIAQVPAAVRLGVVRDAPDPTRLGSHLDEDRRAGAGQTRGGYRGDTVVPMGALQGKAAVDEPVQDEGRSRLQDRAADLQDAVPSQT